MYDSTTTIADFLDNAAAKRPTPGGGSVTALAAALAASMGEMSVNYSIGRKGLEAHQAKLAAAAAELNRARRLLLQLMVEDQLGYEALTATRKMPEGPEREGRMPAALLACVRVPEAIAATSAAILERCGTLADAVNPWLLSDLAVCAQLAGSAARCATFNVRTNVKEVPDAGDRESIEQRMRAVLNRVAELEAQVLPRIWKRHAKEG